MKKFHIIIFGCQMNYADAARIKAVLTNCGFLYTEEVNQADIVIFHTCSVRQKSEDKITGKLKTIRPDQKIRITGCMIQHNLKQGKTTNDQGPIKVGNFMGSIKNKNPKVLGYTANEVNHQESSKQPSEIIPINYAFNPLFYRLTQKRKNIELMWRIDDTGFLPLLLKKLNYTISYDTQLINEYEKILPDGFPTSMNSHQTTAYIPISTGCNQFCSYCIVPYARGLERHFPVKNILEEAKFHIKNGAKEIVLLGQIVNKHPDFLQILQEILDLPGLHRLRYTSPYPTYYSEELVSLHTKEPKLCPHIHMPLQSGSDKILKKMHRGYTLKQTKDWIKNIKTSKRKISITTDIIVGFPGETEADFQKTLALVKYAQFDMIYIGIYSPRPGTFAAKTYPDNIPRSVKRERRNKLNDLLISTSLQNNQQEIGSTKTVLINTIQKKGSKYILQGYTENMKHIDIPSQHAHKVGTYIQATITKVLPFKLYGKLLNKSPKAPK